jgi:hypothetical protein
MSELGKAVLLGLACFAVWLFAMVRAATRSRLLNLLIQLLFPQ